MAGLIISVTQGGVTKSCTTSSYCTFTTKSIKSPIALTRVPATGTAITTPNQFTIHLTGIYLDLKTTITAFLESVVDSTAQYQAWDISGALDLTFQNVPSGQYLLFVHYQNYGYVYFSTVND